MISLQEKNTLTPEKRRPVIGLALGAGALRGLAHIGVLQVLEREGIPIDIVTGTSIGAIVGGAYVAGRTPDEMSRIVRELQELAYFDVTLPRMGVVAGKRVLRLCGQLTHGKSFEQARLPFAVVTCALDTGDEIVLNTGPMDEAIRASISVPGIFVPVDINGRLCVDGGLCNRIPVSVARAMGADRVIAVDVGYRGQPVEPRNLIEIVMQAYDILEWQVAQERSNSADIMISPDVRDMNPAHMSHVDTCVERGRLAAEAMMDDIHAMLAAASLDEGTLSV